MCHGKGRVDVQVEPERCTVGGVRDGGAGCPVGSGCCVGDVGVVPPVELELIGGVDQVHGCCVVVCVVEDCAAGVAIGGGEGEAWCPGVCVHVARSEVSIGGRKNGSASGDGETLTRCTRGLDRLSRRSRCSDSIGHRCTRRCV